MMIKPSALSAADAPDTLRIGFQKHAPLVQRKERQALGDVAHHLYPSTVIEPQCAWACVLPFDGSFFWFLH